MRLGITPAASLAILVLPCLASAQEWATIKGRIVYDGPTVPVRLPINATADKAECVKDKDFLTEDWVVDPKTKGIRDVFVWLAPEGKGLGVEFPANKIHPNLAKPAGPVLKIEQPCCRFIPRVTVARAGQRLEIGGGDKIAHNAKYETDNNGSGNPIIPAGGKYAFKDPLKREDLPFDISCSIHPWMKAYVGVFDHPYAVVTNEKGEFEMKDAPVGNFRLYAWKPGNGFLDGKKGRDGKLITIKPKLDLGDLKMAPN